MLVAETSGQSRSALATVRALAAGGYRAAVTTSPPASLASSSRWCTRRVPAAQVDEPGFSPERYAEAVREELANNDYLTVLPTSDEALLALDYPVAHLIDKGRLAERARAEGIPVPEGRVFESVSDLKAAAEELIFPTVVKPVISRAIPFLAGSPAEVEAHLKAPGPFVVQPYIQDAMRAVAGVMWKGRLQAAVHQRYLRIGPADFGTSSAAETIGPDEELEARLVRLLDGYEGVFQAQLAGDVLLDMNPRPYGSLPLAVAAGANLVAMYCDLLQGKDVPMARGRPGVFYRWAEGDLRSLLGAVRRKRLSPLGALAQLRPHRGAAHSVESLRDPRPLVARASYVLRRRGSVGRRR